MNFLSRIHISTARFVNWAILVIIIYNVFNIHYWTHDKRIIYHDAISYYSYLPATFIYKDLTLSFIDHKTQEDKYLFWPVKTPDNKYVIKMSMGLAYLYAPFFFLGHISAGFQDATMDGFSTPYKFWLVMGSLFYLALGLFFIRKVLEMFFKQWVVSFTIILIVLGTNFYVYATIDPTMPHVYNFFLFSWFLYLTIKWYKNPSFEKAMLLGLIAGLISLIRPSNIIILLILLLWDVKSGNELLLRIKFYLKRPAVIFILAFCFLIIWIPQFFYWKTATGHWLYYSYQDEGFFFLKPQIWKGLFGFRKGWFVYTPVMLFAMAGIIMSFKLFKQFFFPIVFYQLINIYIILSWWCWWYGGSYGNRAFIDSYVLLAIPLAVFLSWLFKQKKIVKIFSNAILILLILLNLFQVRQYYGGVLHYDSMTWKAYQKIWLKSHTTYEYFDSLEHPDYEKAVKGME